MVSGGERDTPEYKLKVLLESYSQDITEINKLLNKDIDVNYTDSVGIPLLISAVRYRNPDIVKHLVSRGADVNIRNLNKDTPLMHTSSINPSKEKFEIVKYLVSMGADINAKNQFGSTLLLKIIPQRYNPIDYEIIKYLISKGADVNIAASDGYTPLMIATQTNNYDIAKLLLENDADVNIIDSIFYTALDRVNNDDIKTKELLLKYNAKSSKELIKIIENNDIKKLKDIVQNEKKIKPKDFFYRNASLLIAASKNKFEITEYLLSQKADPDTKRGDGFTPLILASIEGNIKIIKLLLDKKANIDAQTNSGLTALMMACGYCQNDYLKVVNLLLENGADLNISVLLNSESYKYEELKKILLKKEIGNVNYQDDLGKTPLMKVIHLNDIEIFKIVLEKTSTENINAKTKFRGYTPLMFVVLGGSIEMAKLLLEKGADINYQTKYGESAFSLAIENKKDEMVTFLIENGGYINIALIHTANSFNYKYVKLLLEKGANANTLSSEGKTALDYIIEKQEATLYVEDWEKVNKEYSKFINLLKKYGAKRSSELK